MLRSFLTALLLSISAILSAQNDAVGYNETLVYTASYNMSGILNDIAEIKMETSPVKTSKATLLQLKCTAATYSKWDNFFKIRDLYESYVSPKSLRPYLYKRDISEGGFYKYMKYTFSYKTQSVKSQMKKKNGYEENNTVTIGSSTKDIVSTLYSIRLMDFSTMSVGTIKTFTIIFDNKELKGQFKYLGKETISTALGSKSCYKLALGSRSTDALKGTNSNFLWLTADANKIIVYGKFNIPVGTGELRIKSASGLRN